MKGNKLGGCLLILLIGAALSWGVYECKYYYSYWSDLQNKPWAYSSNKNAKLLVGQWDGNFQDPDRVQKTIHIEIYEPLTDEEREVKASRKSKRGSNANKRGFDGMATVTSKLGTEKYEIYGAVKKDDFHKLHFAFRCEDESKRILPNFTMLGANNGNWQDDAMTITFNFSYQLADGSSHYNSADPRHEKTATTTLHRLSP